MDIRTFDSLFSRIREIEEQSAGLSRKHQDIGLKRWLDNEDVCNILGISKRTLQTYRDKGLLPFSRIRNKLFYRPDDIEFLLQSSYHPNTSQL